MLLWVAPLIKSVLVWDLCWLCLQLYLNCPSFQYILHVPPLGNSLNSGLWNLWVTCLYCKAYLQASHSGVTRHFMCAVKIPAHRCCCSMEQWQRRQARGHCGKSALLTSLCLSFTIGFPECFNPWAPNTLSQWGPPTSSSRSEAYCWPPWPTHSRPFFFGWAPGSQTRPRSWQEHTARRDALLCPRSSTAVQIN